MTAETDRELLELAAKAAGIVIDKSTTNGGGVGNDGFTLLGSAVLDWHNGVTWNPLTDDGDALRLAVKLFIKPDFLIDRVFTGYETTPRCHKPITEKLEPDPYAATRRAIVRAAAEVGRA